MLVSESVEAIEDQIQHQPELIVVVVPGDVRKDVLREVRVFVGREIFQELRML